MLRAPFLFFSIFVYLRSSAVPTSFAGSITTLDGKRIEGVVAIDSKSALMVTPKTGPPQKIELANLLHAEMDTASEETGMTRGVVLSDGTALAAATFRRADADSVKLIPSMLSAEVSIKTVRVARILFGNSPPELLQSVPRGSNGVLLESGDFVEGEFVALENGKIKISSVLFGIQGFDAGRPAKAVVLRDTRPASGAFVVRLTDGSLLPASAISLDRAATQIEKTPFGTIPVKFEDIAEISGGGNRIVSLTALKPSISGGPASLDGLAKQSPPPTLVGLKKSPVNVVHLPANVSVTYELNGDYVSFIAHVGVPAHLVPTQRVQIVVLVDGQERFRSDDRTSVDDALPVAISVRGAKGLTLQIHLDGNKSPQSSFGASAMWVDPLLTRVHGE
ncbi:MAG: NPCBM/NEW2 domain-containing protein [Anaerolineae bacterium]|nr:NPCBM/NEW2 domain-containing protein [Phycisphaerae bacterium]